MYIISFFEIYYVSISFSDFVVVEGGQYLVGIELETINFKQEKASQKKITKIKNQSKIK